MTYKHRIPSALLASMFLTIAATAVSADDAFTEDEREIESCISAVNERANYDDAKRVKHTVRRIRQSSHGYTLKINTDVFTRSSDTAIRKYTSSCLAKGDRKPLKFKISEISA